MSKYWIGIGVVAATALGYFWVLPTYSSLAEAESQAHQAWTQVENAYRRRLDIAQNLVDAIASYAPPESDTVLRVAKTRAHAVVATLPADSLTSAERLSQYKSTQDEFGYALSRLLEEAGRYPALTAGGHFGTLRAEFDDAEKRIPEERRRYAEAALACNARILHYPSRLIARLFGFKPKAYYAADAR